MKVLGLDTSTDSGGVAVLSGANLLAEYNLALQRATHSERLLQVVQQVLHDAGLLSRSPVGISAEVTDDGAGSSDSDPTEADSPDSNPPVDGIAVALGPGSFTGLRIGAVTAKSLAYAWDVPVVGVSTLDALAYQAGSGAEVVCTLMDARHGNVYSAVYDVGGKLPVPLLAPGLRRAADLFPALTDELSGAGYGEGAIVFIGDGVEPYWDDIRRDVGSRAVQTVPALARLRSGAVAALGRERLLRGEGDDPMGLAPVYLRKSEAERNWEQRRSSRSHS